MQTKEINKIAIKPVVYLALESHEILGYDYLPTLYQTFIFVLKEEAVKQH